MHDAQAPGGRRHDQRNKLTAGRRTREYRTKIAEPDPGRVLTESDTGSSVVTTFTVSAGHCLARADLHRLGRRGRDRRPVRAHVRAEVLRAIFTDELSRLDAYAREHRSA